MCEMRIPGEVISVGILFNRELRIKANTKTKDRNYGTVKKPL